MDVISRLTSEHEQRAMQAIGSIFRLLDEEGISTDTELRVASLLGTVCGAKWMQGILEGGK